jgi:hypothetical protein
MKTPVTTRAMAGFIAALALIVGVTSGRAAPSTQAREVARVGVGVDRNRDGTITFDQQDSTSAGQPYVFWVNDDIDRWDEVIPVVDEIQTDREPGSFPVDAVDDVILSERDLEDFERIEITTDRDPEGSGLGITATMLPDAGQPSVNLWPAVQPGLGYLENSSIASRQMSMLPALQRWVRPGAEVPLPVEWFRNPARTAALLFEGRRSGKGRLVIKVRRRGLVIGKAELHLDLRPVGQLYDHFTVADPARPLGAVQLPPVQIGKAETAPEDDSYILLVHGWRMKDWERTRWAAETMLKRLRRLGFRGRFGTFTWPTEWCTGLAVLNQINEDYSLNYDRSERKAFQSGAGLQVVLKYLAAQHPGQVRILAHSMGNVVVAEAFRIQADQTGPSEPPLVETYVATQAAIPTQMYDPSEELVISPRRSGDPPNVYAEYPLFEFDDGKNQYLRGVERVCRRFVNYANPGDFALALWKLNQRAPALGKPDRGYGFSWRPPAFWAAKPTRHRLQFPRDTYEIFAHAAPAYSDALGAESRQSRPVTPFGVPVNLAEEFGFGSLPSDHSAQFHSTLRERRPYWERLMDSFGLAASLN